MSGGGPHTPGGRPIVTWGPRGTHPRRPRQYGAPHGRVRGPMGPLTFVFPAGKKFSPALPAKIFFRFTVVCGGPWGPSKKNTFILSLNTFIL